MAQAHRSLKHTACVLFSDINACSGQTLVAISMLQSLRKLGVKSTLLCRRRIDNNSIQKNFGIDLKVDGQIVLPFWCYPVKTYLEFGLPLIVKPFCDVIINPLTSDILPYVDITYVHYPKRSTIRGKNRNLFWNCYYQAYQSLERALIYHNSNRIVLANSFFTADAVIREYNVKPIVLYPPVDLRLFRKTTTAKKNLVLTISRFSSEKGLERIPLIARNVNAKFVILGSLHSEKMYNEMVRLVREHGVQEKVFLAANAPVSTKVKLLKDAKVYFHTASSEHFGISIVEGMGAGCIPVVSDSGGPREFVPSEWRYHSEEDAASRIQDALVSWSPSIGQEMRDIASKFDKEKFEQKFSEILKERFEKTRLG